MSSKLDIIQSNELNRLVEEWQEYCFILMEKGPSTKVFDDLSRCLHTLKALVRSINYVYLSTFIHYNEDLVNICKNDLERFDKKILDILLDSQAYLSEFRDTFLSGNAVQRGKSQENIIVDKITAITKSEKYNDEDEEGNEIELDMDVLVNSGVMNQEEAEKLQSKIDSYAKTHNSQQLEKTERKSQSELISVFREDIDFIFKKIENLSVHLGYLWFNNNNSNKDLNLQGKTIDKAYKELKLLQSSALKLKMLPLDGLFNKLKRLALDVSRSLDKEIHVNLYGAEERVENSVIENIQGSLMHLIRNAVDHGIEGGEQRAQQRKPSIGKIDLQAKVVGNEINLTIKDDGGGIDVDAISTKLEARGDDITNLSEAQILNKVFEDNFSTKKEISEISGRGVGMAVVKQEVEKLGGRISIQTQKNKGTSFHISLPTSISIIEALIVSVSRTKYALPLSDISQIIDLTEYQTLSEGSYRQYLKVDDENVVPFVNLENLLSSKKTLSHPKQTGIVVASQDEFLVFGVEEAIGQQQIFIRKIVQNIDSNYKGMSIFADGEPGMVIDIKTVAEKYSMSSERKAANE